MSNAKITMNADLVANGTVYANGPVFVQGVDIKKFLEELNDKIIQITDDDLPKIKNNIDKLLKDFPISGSTKTHLEKLREWIEAGRSSVEIIKYIQQIWVEVGPIVTDVLSK